MNHYLVKPSQKVKLGDWNPDDQEVRPGGKRKTEKTLEDLEGKLDELQELLYAESKHRLLVVLQGIDTAGKDGVIRHVFHGVNPQGVKVAAFKVPTPDDLAHDYLWRVHPHVPANGEIVIFNRSHYEDVLVVRVHQLAPETIWRRRFDQINEFEKILSEEGTTILKFYLHISQDEQKKRLEQRRDDPRKRWKLSSADIKERQLWDDYQRAYEEMLSRTSTSWAPWMIVPSNHKNTRNLIVATALVQALENLKMSYPQPSEDIQHMVIP
jgi:PPK2 family polyphosphate:nucleotide phosphotransferase